jgi:hypothetical protein
MWWEEFDVTSLQNALFEDRSQCRALLLLTPGCSLRDLVGTQGRLVV